MSGLLRVAIVDASAEMHVAIATVLGGQADLRIVEHARSLPELCDAKPEAMDVVVADLRACIGYSFHLAELRRDYPGLRLLITLGNDGAEYQDAIERLAADGWVKKTELADALLSALRRLPR
jgi:DNA-binding NarL/FixJ family response regulator